MANNERRGSAGYTLDEGLSEIGFGKFQWLVLIYSGLGSFAEAMEMMILSFIGPAVKSQWLLSSSQESLLTTSVFAGMLFGAYSWGLLSDSFGRRKSILGSTILTFGAGLLSTFAPNFLSLAILRSLVGIGLSSGSVFLSWFLEFVPTSNRGKWLSFQSIFWTLGTIFEAALAWLVMPRLSWRWLLAFSSFPSLALLLFYHFTPESPRYLCSKGRYTDAHKILEKIAQVNQSKLPRGMLVSDYTTELDEESSSSIHEPLLSSARKRVFSFKSLFSSVSMLCSSNLIKTTLLLWVVYFANSFIYYGVILLTSELSGGQNKCRPAALHLENALDDSLYIDTFITSLAELPGILLSAILIDRIGRKRSLIFMFVVAGIFLFPLSLHQSAISTTSLLFGARICAIGTFTVACIYCPELYPTSVRTTGSGAASAVGRIGGMLCPLVAVGLVTECHLREAIILFEVVAAISVVCVIFFPFETKGRELSDSVASFDQDHNISVS